MNQEIQTTEVKVKYRKVSQFLVKNLQKLKHDKNTHMVRRRKKQFALEPKG